MNLIFQEELLVYTQTYTFQNQSNNRLIVFVTDKEKENSEKERNL